MNELNLNRISHYALLFLVFILPIWLLPYTIFPVEINKAFLFYVFTIFALIFWLISILQKANFRIPKSGALLALAAIILVWLASSLFSSNAAISLIGSGYEVGTLFSLILMGFALFLMSVIFQSESRAKSFYLAVFSSSLLVFIFQFFHSVLNITILPWNIFSQKISNTIGAWNEFGIFFGFIALSALVFAELFRLSKWLKVFIFTMLFVSLIAVALVNFTTIWIVLGSFLLIFLVYFFFSGLKTASSGVATGDRNLRKFFRFTIFLLLIIVFFIMAKVLIGDLVSSMGITSIEVRPGWNATWQVVRSVLEKSPLLGTGPNTFLYDWLKFKPADINLTLFWAYPFQAGIGLLSSWLAVSGILGGLAWLVFIIFLIFYGLKIVAEHEDETLRGLLAASFLGSLYLWTFAIIYPVGFLLIALAFLTSGVFIALLCRSGKIKIIEVSFLDKPKLGFILSLVVFLLMIAGVATSYLIFQKYWAAYSFGKGVAIINAGGNMDEAEGFISRAARFDQQDRYYRGLSEIGVMRLQNLLAQTDLPADELRARFQNILGGAISSAQTAAHINPLDYQNWMSLGQVYEIVIPLKIAGAREAAISAYNKAAEQAPFDPRPLFASGRAEIQANDIKSAKIFLDSAVNLKKDYSPAVFLLAQLEVQGGNLKEAIKRMEQAYFLAPNDIGVLLQLGLLYYQDKNYEAGRLVLEKAVSINQNYSNARYFLGLIYDQQGRKNDAIEQFKQIEKFNPDNQEVKIILSNLSAGKPVLESISPPQLSPEKRDKAPINEENSEKTLPKKK